MPARHKICWRRREWLAHQPASHRPLIPIPLLTSLCCRGFVPEPSTKCLLLQASLGKMTGLEPATARIVRGRGSSRGGKHSFFATVSPPVGWVGEGPQREAGSQLYKVSKKFAARKLAYNSPCRWTTKARHRSMYPAEKVSSHSTRYSAHQ